jgi:hypothetical protein
MLDRPTAAARRQRAYRRRIQRCAAIYPVELDGHDLNVLVAIHALDPRDDGKPAKVAEAVRKAIRAIDPTPVNLKDATS